MRNRYLILLLLMVATAFFGELKMNPFGEPFRFSLGTTCFFFGLIWFRQLRPLETGIGVGVSLLLFRGFLDINQGQSLAHAFQHHLPSTVYYLIFAVILTCTNLRRRLEKPLAVGVIGAGSDLIANIGELLLRNQFGGTYTLDLHTLLILALFGSLRSFFVVGLYNMLMIRQLRLLGEQQKEQIEHLLLLNASLYEEGFYLNKSMGHIEDITRNSYDLYKQLKGQEKAGVWPTHFSRQALSIAEEVHELKKDSQRILAGLDKLLKQEAVEERISLRALTELVMQANRKYALMLGKDIEFHIQANVNLNTNRTYALVSILNNLVANSVEAIPRVGRIGLDVRLVEAHVEWMVWDDGPGIPDEEAEYVFQPGYTTKYDSRGNPSTGIGLSHCTDLTHMLGGTLEMRRRAGTTQFSMRMPTAELLQKHKEEWNS
ncbi:sensor histidine kinase [Tumebacillus permanentifrigoris]|uniref:histidine kinase n=1 Tax=Tumebacillus permanentifrigoris TaxID=378543 RepID=A0A316D9X7_9BACL|nr:ATP-binding protein [Tumebacillus permanentifrigoris]PWK13433.1 two-component system sensor histidine kinase YcbA [Tumebacillus permanentifrigoris]